VSEAAWLEPALAYVADWLAFQIRVTEQPGCIVAVAHKGELVFEAAFGKASLATGEPLTPRHRFRVASHSKTFTATAVMKLREQGRLTLDDRAGDHVRGLHPDVASATLAQLLSHTAGIMRDGPDCAYWVDRAPFLDEAALRSELAEPPSIGAAERLKYSNHGFGLAGMVIEAVTGEPYRDWVRREVIDAAGLAETTPDVPIAPGVPFARGHSGKALHGRRLTIPGDQSTHALAPATGFVSTAADLVRFFSQTSPNAPGALLTPTSRRLMTHAQWPDPWSALKSSYGLGVIAGDLDGWELFGHTGGFVGYASRTAVAPAHELAVSCLANAVDGSAYGWLDGTFAILRRFKEDGPPAAALNDWRGRWWSLWGPTDLVPVGDKVLLAAPGAPNPLLKAGELEVSGPDQARISQAGGFATYGEPAKLIRGADGAVSEVKLGGGRLVSEAALAAETLARYEAEGAPV
jgi:CubicO group peptidase (beta-lactamase class C family)